MKKLAVKMSVVLVAIVSGCCGFLGIVMLFAGIQYVSTRNTWKEGAVALLVCGLVGFVGLAIAAVCEAYLLFLSRVPKSRSSLPLDNF